MKWWLSLLVASPAFAGSLGLIEVDAEEVQVRLAAILVHRENKVTIRVCKDPIKDFPINCVTVGEPIAFEDFEAQVKAHLKLTPETAQKESDIARRQAVLLFLRSEFRKKIERGDLDINTKDSGELELQGMVEKIDPDGIARKREAAEAIWAKVSAPLIQEQKLPREPNETFFKSLEREAFESALAPFQQVLSKVPGKS